MLGWRHGNGGEVVLCAAPACHARQVLRVAQRARHLRNNEIRQEVVLYAALACHARQVLRAEHKLGKKVVLYAALACHARQVLRVAQRARPLYNK